MQGSQNTTAIEGATGGVSPGGGALSFDELVQAAMELRPPLSVHELYRGRRRHQREARDLVCWYAYRRLGRRLSYAAIAEEMGEGGRSGVRAAVARVERTRRDEAEAFAAEVAAWRERVR